MPKTVDYRKDLITVPSCDLHNASKSNDDVFLLLGLTLCISNNSVAIHHIRTKIDRALKKDPNLFGRFAKASIPVTAIADDVPAHTLMVKIDNRRFLRSLDHVARGLYRHELRKRFEGRCSIVSDFLLYAEPGLNERNAQALALVRPQFETLPSRGANPRIFNYLFLSPDEEGLIALRMQFYEGSNVYVAYIPQ